MFTRIQVNAQLRVPAGPTVTVTVPTVDPSVAVRQRTPLAPAANVADIVPPLVLQVTFELPAVSGATPTPREDTKTAHSLPRPKASPMAAPAAAALRACKYLGKATAARIPITATTIINSTRVKPLWNRVLFLRREDRRASWRFALIIEGIISLKISQPKAERTLRPFPTVTVAVLVVNPSIAERQ